MRRLHLVETADLEWFPKMLRNYETDILRFSLTRFRIYDAVVPLIARCLERTGASEVTDLCSGGGGPWTRLQPLLSASLGRDVSVTLTDLRPNLPALEQVAAASGGSIRFVREPVDATAAGSSAQVRTLFTAFHHFRPELARRVLRDARDSRAAIGVFEFNARTVLSFASMFLSPLMVLAATPFLRPVRLSRLLLTYIVPIVPLNTLFNGTVSSLRTYSLPELRELCAELEQPGYEWECGVTPIGRTPPVTYLLGIPSER